MCQLLHVKMASETNESALKVSLILGGLHVTLYAARVKPAAFARMAKAERGCLDLLHGAFDVAATFDFNFTVSHVARDFARVAYDEHAFAGDGLVQLTLDINEISFCGASHNA